MRYLEFFILLEHYKIQNVDFNINLRHHLRHGDISVAIISLLTLKYIPILTFVTVLHGKEANSSLIPNKYNLPDSLPEIIP
jgi:hypothetical protein